MLNNCQWLGSPWLNLGSSIALTLFELRAIFFCFITVCKLIWLFLCDDTGGLHASWTNFVRFWLKIDLGPRWLWLLPLLRWWLCCCLFIAYRCSGCLWGVTPCFVTLTIVFLLEITLLGKRELVALLFLSSGCHVAVIVICLLSVVRDSGISWPY